MLLPLFMIMERGIFMKFELALKHVKNGKKIRRDCFVSTSHLEIYKDELVRVNRNGAVKICRISSADLLATDWKSIKE